MSVPFKSLLVAGLCFLLASVAYAGAGGTRTHTVYAGQRLGSIAKRYNVSVAAISKANDIGSRGVIKPGQKLIIPSRSDKDGSRAREIRLGRSGAGSSGGSGTSSSRRPNLANTKTHIVQSGQRLGSIAKRYNVSVTALSNANGIKPTAPIRPKQKLLVPPRTDKDGFATRERYLDKLAGVSDAPGTGGGWRRYARAPKQRGYVELIGHSKVWKGTILTPGGDIRTSARQAISRVLTAPKNRRVVDERLIRLLVKVSDTFGGRPVRIISGYRSSSYVKTSRHRKGKAVDLRIAGVPNEALRDYLRTFSKVGVGYYPNSTFVHFDVREQSAYWVDYSGPGEAPRLRR